MGTTAFSVGTTAASTSTVIVGSLAGGVSARLSSLDQLIAFLSCGVAGKGLAIRSAPSLALIPRGTQGSVDRGIGGVGYWAAACPEKKKEKG